jgi:chaperonin GroES
MFQLLGLLMEFAREISATADVMTGDTGGKAMAPTTTLALIEQGMQVFTAVFKRLHRALGRELEMHANLNAKHLSAEDYNAFFDDPQEQYDPKVDYDLKDMNITPVSDPTVATNMQKLAKSQLAREIAGPPGSKPYINYQEIDKRAFEAAEIPDPDGLFAPQQPPDPMAEAVKTLTLQELFEKVIKLRSESIKNVADAESKEAGDQLALLNQFLSTLQAGHAMETQDNAPIPGGPGGLPSMAGPPGNAMGAGPLPPGGNGGGGGAAGPPAQQQPSVDPAAMGGTASPVGAPAGAM